MKHKRNEDIDVYDMETCEICNQSFKSNAALRGHRYRYHADRDHKYSRSPKGNKNVTLCKICQFPCARVLRRMAPIQNSPIYRHQKCLTVTLQIR